MSRQGHPLGRRDSTFGVATRRLHGEQKAVATQLLMSRHGRSNLMSRHGRSNLMSRHGRSNLMSRHGLAV